MEDTIEICSGCGKMPRAIDLLAGHFLCSRCGNRMTMHVSADNYEKVVTELDRKFHMVTQKKRIEAAASAPVELRRKPPKSKAGKKPSKPKKKAAAKKPAKKKRRK
jgi:hypothetical protein